MDEFIDFLKFLENTRSAKELMEEFGYTSGTNFLKQGIGEGFVQVEDEGLKRNFLLSSMGKNNLRKLEAYNEKKEKHTGLPNGRNMEKISFKEIKNSNISLITGDNSETFQSIKNQW